VVDEREGFQVQGNDLTLFDFIFEFGHRSLLVGGCPRQFPLGDDKADVLVHLVKVFEAKVSNHTVRKGDLDIDEGVIFGGEISLEELHLGAKVTVSQDGRVGAGEKGGEAKVAKRVERDGVEQWSVRSPGLGQFVQGVGLSDGRNDVVLEVKVLGQQTTGGVTCEEPHFLDVFYAHVMLVKVGHDVTAGVVLSGVAPRSQQKLALGEKF